MQVLKERDMKLLSRKRVTLMLDKKGPTPSRLELIKEVAKKFKTKEDLVIIKHIYPQFGQNKTKLIVHLYEDKGKMEMFEHEDLLKKHKEEPKKEEKTEEKKEAPAEKPAEELPKEEATEQKEEAGKEENTEEKQEEKKPAEGQKKDKEEE